MEPYNLTIEDIAKRLKVAPNTVRIWARDGLITGIKLRGRMWRFTEQEYSNFLKRENLHGAQ